MLQNAEMQSGYIKCQGVQYTISAYIECHDVQQYTYVENVILTECMT